MTGLDRSVVSSSQILDVDGGQGELFELTQRGLHLEGNRLGGYVAKAIRVGHAPEISTEQLRTAIANERSLLASQLRKGRVAAGSAASVEKMARVTELALTEAEEAAELAARAAALNTKGEVSKLAREAAKALGALAAGVKSSEKGDCFSVEARRSTVFKARKT